MKNGRCQCIVIRNNKILMVKHVQQDLSYLCLPGGGTEPNETMDTGALRELQEECNVSGTIIRQTSELFEKTESGIVLHATYFIDIGEQTPSLGFDPEVTGEPVLQGTGWYALDEICERDRAYLWAAGLNQIEAFSNELESWGDDISYPQKREVAL
jgi:ADP-ribose pyrophosphatase YjhB (NUDIX family)